MCRGTCIAEGCDDPITVYMTTVGRDGTFGYTESAGIDETEGRSTMEGDSGRLGLVVAPRMAVVALQGQGRASRSTGSWVEAAGNAATPTVVW